MRVVVQRSLKSKVLIAGKTVAEISRGMVCLACFEKEDREECLNLASRKLSSLRMFPDREGRMAKDITQTGGEFLCVSQFTLSWRGTGGNRPSFEQSMPFAKAKKYYDTFCEKLNNYASVKRGIFGETMQIQIENDGPVTFFLQF
ncbi:MAG: D-aminoacyl-tRNA deacylase [Halobacteriovoraceae bacterium]|nr:D-aminoacyl-tRNA deacylase [Halobacteriovoraceae bacterium]